MTDIPFPVHVPPEIAAAVEGAWPHGLSEKAHVNQVVALDGRSEEHRQASARSMTTAGGVEASSQGGTSEALHEAMFKNADMFSGRADRDAAYASGMAFTAQNIHNQKGMINALVADYAAKSDALQAANIASGGTQPQIVAMQQALQQQAQAAMGMLHGGFSAAHEQLKANIASAQHVMSPPALMPPALPTTGNMMGWGAVPGMPSQYADTVMAGNSQMLAGGGFDGTPGSLINTLLTNAPAVAQLAQTGMAIGDQAFNQIQQAAAVGTAFVAGALGEGADQLAEEGVPVPGAEDGGKPSEGLARAMGLTHPGAGAGDDEPGIRPSSVGEVEPEDEPEDGPEEDAVDTDAPPAGEFRQGGTPPDTDASTTAQAATPAPEPQPAPAPAEPAPTPPPAPAEPGPNPGGGAPTNIDPVAQSAPAGTAGGGAPIDQPATRLSGIEVEGTFTAGPGGASLDVSTSLTGDSSGGQVSTHTTAGAAGAPVAGLGGGGAAAAGAGGMGMMPMGAMGGMGGPMGGPAGQGGRSKLAADAAKADPTTVKSLAEDERLTAIAGEQADPEAEEFLAHFSESTVRGIRVAAHLLRTLDGTDAESEIAVAVYASGDCIFATEDVLGFPRRGQTLMPEGVKPLAAVESLPPQFRLDWSGSSDPASVVSFAAHLGLIPKPEAIITVDRDPTLPLPGGVEVVSRSTVERVTPAARTEGSVTEYLPVVTLDDLPLALDSLSRDWRLPLDDKGISSVTERDAFHGMTARRWADTTHPQIAVATIWWLLAAAHDSLANGDVDYARAAVRAVLGYPRPGA